MAIGNMLTVDEAAKAIGVTPGRVRQFICENRFVGLVRFGRRSWGIPESEVQRLKSRPRNNGRPRKKK